MRRFKLVLVSLLLSFMLGVTITSSYAATVKLNNTSITLKKGTSYKLKLSGTSNKKYWSSSKKSIATVSSTGKVKAKKAGTCYITVKYGKKKKKCKVKVVSSSSGASISASGGSKSDLTGDLHYAGEYHNGDGSVAGSTYESDTFDLPSDWK